MLTIKLPFNIKYFLKYKKNHNNPFANLIVDNESIFITDGGYSMIKLPDNGYEIIEGQFEDGSYMMREYIVDGKKDKDYCIIKFEKEREAPLCEVTIRNAFNNSKKKGELYRIGTKGKIDIRGLALRLGYLIIETQVPIAYHLFETFFTLLSDISYNLHKNNPESEMFEVLHNDDIDCPIIFKENIENGVIGFLMGMSIKRIEG